MPMADLKQLEFYVLRYVPYVNRVDCISIGVLLLEPLPDSFGFADVRMTSDWRRVGCFNSQVDIDVLQGLETDIRVQLQNSHDPRLFLLKLEDSHSNMIQISARQVCLAADPPKELKRLCALNVDEPQGEALPAISRPKNEHAMILAGIEDALTRAGIWALRMERVSAAQYTKKNGDRLVFDFGYVIGPEVRFFQAVPLKTPFNQAIAANIAHHFPKVADCIHAKNGSRALLTAIVADSLDRTNPEIEFALDAFKDNNVRVAAVADMPSIADRTRQDLNTWRG
jgi:Protein of unknown function (DUF3037)